MDNIKQKVFSGLIWRFLERFGAQLVSFVVSVILARLLEPKYYGEISLVMIIANILQVLIDSGFGNALIQKKDADDKDFSTVFYFNISACVILYILLFAVAPLIADFYAIDNLTPVIRVVGVIILISGVKNVQQAYVSKHMLFKKFFYSTLGGTVVAAIIAIIMAYKGFGIWALVAQYVINPCIDTIILWITVKWRPTKSFSLSRLKKLFSFGWKLLVVSLITEIFNNIRDLVIGKVYSTEDLAYYNNGKKVPTLLTQNLDSTIRSVLFPALASEQDNKELVKAHMLRTIKISNYILMPLLLGTAACAKQIVVLLWTDKWIASVPFLQIMCLVWALNSIQATNQQTIIALGYSNIALRVEIIIKCISLGFLVAFMRISTLAIALSTLGATIVSVFINLWPNRKILNCSIRSQLKNIMPETLLSLFMAVVVAIIGYTLKCSTLITFIIQVFVGITIYLIGSVVFKMESFSYVKGLLLPALNKLRRR